MLSLKKSIQVLAMTAALTTVSTVAHAEEARVVNDGYSVSEQTGQVVRDSYGQCWHTASWTPEKATVIGCDGYTGAAVEAPTKEIRRFTLKTDTLFGFDKVELHAEGKKALDQLFTELKDIDPKDGKILINGYTDRIGSAQYNLGLSLRRANTVRTYLIGKGVPATKIVAEGHGKTNSLTGDTCKRIANLKNLKERKELILCLQPDRRVEVEVHGKRVVINN